MEDQKQHTSSDPAPQDALALCQKQCEEYLAGWKRTQADFINYKKDESRRISELAAFSHKDFIADLLPVLDSLDLALLTVESESPAHKGMIRIKGQLLDVLKRQGVMRIEVAPGDEIDPRLHEALIAVDIHESDTALQGLSGKVIEELSAGYTLSGRVIRPAKVKIGK